MIVHFILCHIPFNLFFGDTFRYFERRMSWDFIKCDRIRWSRFYFWLYWTAPLSGTTAASGQTEVAALVALMSLCECVCVGHGEEVKQSGDTVRHGWWNSDNTLVFKIMINIPILAYHHVNCNIPTVNIQLIGPTVKVSWRSQPGDCWSFISRGK